MIRLSLLPILAAIPIAATAANTCNISGAAYDYHGKPLPSAVVRLIDTRTQQAEFLSADAQAAFRFTDLAPGASYRLDLISPPTVVTGTHLPTRSILGISPAFACAAGESTRANVRVQVD